MSSKKQPRRTIDWFSRSVTTFYPQYTGAGRDKVEAVRSVRPTRFQEVFARYNLSATETRDEGVGPMMEDVRYDRPVPPPRRRKATKTPQSPAILAKPRRRKRIRTDFDV